MLRIHHTNVSRSSEPIRVTASEWPKSYFALTTTCWPRPSIKRVQLLQYICYRWWGRLEWAAMAGDGGTRFPWAIKSLSWALPSSRLFQNWILMFPASRHWSKHTIQWFYHSCCKFLLGYSCEQLYLSSRVLNSFIRSHVLGFFVKILRTKLVDGTIATLANHGVAQTLKINLRGNIAFVIAYAVANLCAC